MGLKRLDFSKVPDQKVELDRDATPLPSDAGEVLLLRQLLAGTQLEAEPLRLAYDAQQHGWSYREFHSRVDGFGAALVAATTAGGQLVGGYCPLGWISLGEDRASNGAFLFCWPGGDTRQRAVKLPKVGGPNLAVIDKPDAGPSFGPDGLVIPLRPGSGERLAKCKLGPYYARLPGGGKSMFGAADGGGGPNKAELTGLRVYVAEGSGEEWALDGITWKSQRRAA